MKILMVTSEVVPFSKTGGLADVASALSINLAKEGNEVQVFMPMYSFIDSSGFKIIDRFSVDTLSTGQEVTLYEREEKNVKYIGLSHPLFSERKGVYGDTSFTPYSDNCFRFMFFSYASVLYIKKGYFSPDVVHLHDWTTGTIPYLLKSERLNIPTVFTIHNLAYQGVFPRFDTLLLGKQFPFDLLSASDNSLINMMEAGLRTATEITTVSPSYAKEILTREQGCGLEDLLKSRSESLSGIINGIDTEEWNSETDIYFTEHFNKDNLEGKARIKARLQREFGLEEREDIPLVTMISRLAEQKGFSELLLDGTECALESILKNNAVQFLIIGTGDERYTSKLAELEAKYSNLKFRSLFSTTVAHNIEAGGDFFLMPSKYEPCGLNQLYSECYGTLPIAHRIGGLKDSIRDADEVENGTGFLFDTLSRDEIIKAVERALSHYSNKEEFSQLRKNAMSEDHTWTKSTGEYTEIYKRLTQRGNGGKK